MPKYKSSRVPCDDIKQYVVELILRCGSPEKASELSGVGTTTLYRIRHSYNCTMNRNTAQSILVALAEKRKEDRKVATVSDKLSEAIKQSARHEERMERMLGY